jgi:hypothetical protein
MVVLDPDAVVAPHDLGGGRRPIANGVLTNAAKNGDTGRHDGSAEEAGNLGSIGLPATRRYEPSRREKNYWF